MSQKKIKAKHLTAGQKTGILLGVCILVCIIVLLILAPWKGKGTDKMTYADITIKNYGTVTVALDADAAPITVANFVKLSESGFYDGLTFHRIIKGFMAQGGDPQGNGFGGSDETIKGEFAVNGVNNPLSHTRGTISMARSGLSYDSASSQFFIVQQDAPHLNGQYAAFGHVTEGMDIIDKLCQDARPIDNNGTIPPEAQPVIESIKIRKP